MKKFNYVISVVVPCFNEEKNIPLLVSELQEVLKEYTYEIILVDDGSTDQSRQIYEQLSFDQRTLHFIRFSRNFGHQAALQAGITHANGDVIITIDADLQQPPSLIPEMIGKWLGGAEIVEAVPVHTDSISWFKKKSSYFYYYLLNKLSEFPVVKSANDFRLIDKKVADIVRNLPENHLYLRGLFSWMGFKHVYIQYAHLKRVNGESHYSLKKMVKLALCGITTMSIKPLRLALVIGIIISLTAFCVSLWVLYVFFFTDEAVPGWSSNIVSTLFLSGIQLLVTGIMGEYLGKLFIENKRRPNYIISKSNLEKRKEIALLNSRSEIKVDKGFVVT